MPRSEYEGKGVEPSGVHDKDPEALTAGEKLRLIYRTGQEEDPTAPIDPHTFRGGFNEPT